MKKFTLIELLVVIVIIALLISMLMPSLSRAKLKAKITACKNNKSQLGKGFLMYAKDNKGNFPRSSWDIGYGTHVYYKNSKYWNVDGIHEYVTSDGAVFYCPTRSTSPKWGSNNILPLENDSLHWTKGTSEKRGDYVYRDYINNSAFTVPQLFRDESGLTVSADFWYRKFGGYFHGGTKNGVSALHLDGSVSTAKPGYVTINDGSHAAKEQVWQDEFDY